MKEPAFKPGTYVQVSDRQYYVNFRGEWRRVPKDREVQNVIIGRLEAPFHIDGRDPRTGWFCWCFPCLREYHPK